MKKFRLYTTAAVILAAMIFLFAACSSAKTEAGYPSLDSAGFDALLEQSRGKPLVLCFWTTWCPACREEIPELGLSAADYGDKVVFAAVSMDEKREAVEKFFAKEKPGVPVYMGDQTLASRFKVSAIPHLVVFNGQGEVTFSRAGLFPRSMLAMLLNKILEK
ncbi:TlpA family protein disulfide reductase [Pseudodesulfovibrio senegalensis]|jgi:thiol-disulfide isomerase/thioredoxin|uniref:TlpA family protein disulfide reductase n=1 Tax=Pseudodesulfovibrio senegalensis TaxID=1721087 RepID=A0A6N6MYI4_9BACT|nr:TlpA disulfide reductase family protein [Pseudodesulfovibrio senegalensis]KAB1439098.1 TlpA family protein disulfide reductase [Pseudodesulfovibrio senegalensis]